MKRVEVVGNITPAQGRARPGRRAKIPTIITAGSLNPIKGYDVLLRALALLSERGSAFRVLLVGDGPERKTLERLANQLMLGECVTFVGEVEDVQSLMAQAEIMVHPSRSESLSNSIMEAMGEGLPIIATNVGGTVEIVRDGWNGLLVPPDQPDLLAGKIHLLLERPDLRGTFGARGLKLMQEKYSAPKVSQQFSLIYKSLLGR
jgi:glycosyltransferase involved in cell wall biosynthesis